MENILKIDCSSGEGGGQIMRLALTISVLYKIPVELNNIRSNRPKPGLANQHMTGIKLLQEINNAHVEGVYVGSTNLIFIPEMVTTVGIRKTTFTADTQTAGCISLLAQIVLPCLLFAPSSKPIQLILKGGTNVPLGPQIEYFTEVFRPVLNKFGGHFEFNVERRGYYPKGGGVFHLKVQPINSLRSVELLSVGSPLKVDGWAFVAGGCKIHEAQQMADDSQRALIENLKKNNIPIPTIDIMSYKEVPDGPICHCSGINLVCTTSSGCILGGSGLKSKFNINDPIGANAAKTITQALIDESCVDEYMQDQIIVLMALAKGTSKVVLGNSELTSHTKSAIDIFEKMLASRGLKFKFYRRDGESGPLILECNGIGIVNDFVKQ